jgi:hypothetical protein
MKKTKSKKCYSSRAPILKRVLDCINADDFEDYGDYIVFGNTDPDTDEHTEALREFVSDIKKHVGTKESAKRVSLDGVPDFPRMRGIDRLPAGFLRELHGALQSDDFENTVSSLMTPSQIEAGTLDSLDARYASEVVGKLDKIVFRAFTLDPVAIKEIPSKNVREYFKEAHSCYLFGQRVACAVLCRAMLESALVQKLDPTGSVESDTLRRRRGGQEKHSYFLALLEKSTALLSDDRPEWAKKIKNAGDWAIHDFERFNREFPADRLGQIVDNTRKILIDLYS